MNSNIRTIECSVSADNLLAMLHVTGLLKDTDEILSVSFQNSVQGVDLKNTPLAVVPLTIKLKEKIANNGT